MWQPAMFEGEERAASVIGAPHLKHSNYRTALTRRRAELRTQEDALTEATWQAREENPAVSRDARESPYVAGGIEGSGQRKTSVGNGKRNTDGDCGRGQSATQG